ncbi:MAG: hypothetical protein VX498_00005, partial [Myxococcota bacterium]|nr:hypothetical protein [Myxococcota bacterium]
METVDFSMAGAFKHFTPLTWGVFIILLVMSVASLAVALNRAFFFFRTRGQSALFENTVKDALLKKKDVDAVLRQAGSQEYRFSYLATIVSSGLNEARAVKEAMGNLDKL